MAIFALGVGIFDLIVGIIFIGLFFNDSTKPFSKQMSTGLALLCLIGGMSIILFGLIFILIGISI